MGWFSDIFSKKEEIEESPSETLSIDELDDWFGSVSEKKFDSLRSDIEQAFDMVREQKEFTRTQLDKLNSAVLRNPNIPEKAIQIMEGNREAFTKQYGFFLDSIDVPDAAEYNSTNQFCDRFTKDTNELVQSCTRNMQILNEFFSRELGEVSKCMKRMSDAVEFIKTGLAENNQDIVFMDGLKEDITKLHEKLAREKELRKDVDELHEKKNSSKSLRDKLKKQEESLKNSSEYANYERLSKEREALQEDERLLKKDMHHLFSQIDRALRKYERIAIENQDIVQKYAEDPVSAILEDGNLVVMSVLDRMKTNVADGTLGLKEKDQEKTLQRIESMSRDIFEQFVFRYEDIKKARRKVEDQFNSSRVVRELEDAQYKLNHITTQMDGLQDKIDLTDKSLDRLQIEATKNRLEEQLGFFIRGEVHLELPHEKPESSLN